MSVKDTLKKAYDVVDTDKAKALALIKESAEIQNATNLFDDIMSVEEIKDDGAPTVDADYQPFDINRAKENYYYVEPNGIDELRVSPVDSYDLSLTIREAMRTL